MLISQIGAAGAPTARARKDAMRLALYQPDIAQNTGTILRMAACFGVAVDIVGPTGFDMTDRALRRAGLDYLDHVVIARHPSFEAFDAARRGGDPVPRLVALTTQGETRHVDFQFNPDDVLLLGRESAGLPQAIHETADARVRVPIGEGLRSLNVAVAGAIALAEALRQTGRFADA